MDEVVRQELEQRGLRPLRCLEGGRFAEVFEAQSDSGAPWAAKISLDPFDEQNQAVREAL